MTRREAPKGWKCSKDGHYPDPDFPGGGPAVRAQDGRAYAFPTGRCLACACLYAEKQELSEETVEQMTHQQRVVTPDSAGSLLVDSRGRALR